MELFISLSYVPPNSLQLHIQRMEPNSAKKETEFSKAKLGFTIDFVVYAMGIVSRRHFRPIPYPNYCIVECLCGFLMGNVERFGESDKVSVG